MAGQRLTELFEQGIELAPGERAAWVAAACGGNDGLRAELERLLRADERAVHFLEKPPALIADALVESASGPTAVSPQRYGPWRALRSIGVGGMGEVWLAERSDGEFEQRVAIKQLAYPTPGLLNRFRQERQILARLEHANIARLIDGGVDAVGAPYLVMEYVEGVPITDYARAHALDLRARLDLFLRVCEGVQYAHQNLVVHRDLKPSNIFVTSDGVPKLLDFGIAKVLATTDEAAATQTVARMLTPDYAAPEQFSGGAITTATDVYALGVVLYELLADTRPPRRMQGDATNPAAVPPPSAALDRTTANMGARRRALRGDLDRIVLVALAHQPQRRYPSAEALAADIRRYLGGRPVVARGDSAWYRFRKFAKRNGYALAAAAIAFSACIAATVVSVNQARLARDQKDVALEQTNVAHEHAQRSEAVRQFLVGVFEQASPDENKGQPFTAQQLLQKGERQLSEAPDMNPAIQADLTGLIGRLYWNISDNVRAETLLKKAVASNSDPRVPDEVKARNLLALSDMETDKHLTDAALDHATQASRFARTAAGAGVEQLSEARRTIGKALIRKGNAPQAEAKLREALAGDLATFGEHHASVADDWQLLGTALDELSRYDESAMAFQHAITIWSSLRGERSIETAGGFNDLGLLLLHKGDLSGAEDALRKSLGIEAPLDGPDNDNLRVIRSNLLRTIELQGRFEEAIRQRTDILEDARKRVEKTRPDALAFEYNFIGSDYRELGRFDKAEAAARDALAIWLKIHGSNDESDSATPMGNLGVALALHGQYAEAENSLAHSLAIQQRNASPTSQWLNMTRAEYGTVLRLQHRYSDALRELGEASLAVKRTAGEANPWLAILDAQLSEAELDAGDAGKAEATAAAALAVARKALPQGNYRLGPPLFALARAKLALGHPEEADALLREALSVRGPPRATDDPRVLEVKVALVNALAARGKGSEARALAIEVEPLLKASASPYAADLRARLTKR